MKTVRKVCFTLALLAVTAFQHLGAYEENPNILEVYLKKACVVSGETLSLNDVIQSYSGKYAFQELEKLAVPFRGDRLVILPAESIRATIRREYLGALILVGQQIMVMPEKMASERDRWFYEKMLEFIMRGRYPADARIEVELIGVAEIPDRTIGDPRFDIRSTTVRNGLNVGETAIAFRGDGQHETGVLNVILHVFVGVSSPVTVIRTGQRFSGESLCLLSVDLARIPEDLLLSGRERDAYTATQDLLPREPIPLKKITRTLFVRGGDKVSIIFVKKNLFVETTGRAFESGGIDDTVSVRPDGAKKKFQALVTGDKEVFIELR